MPGEDKENDSNPVASTMAARGDTWVPGSVLRCSGFLGPVLWNFSKFLRFLECSLSEEALLDILVLLIKKKKKNHIGIIFVCCRLPRRNQSLAHGSEEHSGAGGKKT